MNKFKPILPKEHGLWAWALLPTIVGGLSASEFNFKFLLLLFTVLSWLLAFTPARMIYKERKKETRVQSRVRMWASIYSSFGIFFFAWGVVLESTTFLILIMYAPFFYLGVRASHVGFQKSFLFEFGGITVLSSLSFAGAFCVRGEMLTPDFALWAFIAILLLERSLQTRHSARSIAWRSSKPPTLDSLKPVFRMNLFVSLSALVAGSVVLALFKLKNIFLAIYAPGFILTSLFCIKPPRSLRTIGWTEVVVSILFAYLLVRLSPNLYG